jgi:autotransporter strand-loop-strand O-heptosyltransferase
MSQFNEDIFVIDCWIDTIAKEKNLINLIERLKMYDIPILVTGHYPIKPEIQQMVDFYLFDKNNPLLMRDEFQKYGVNSVRWTDMGDFRIENHREFHHDYAIWETMRNAFNFCKYLGKKYIHFMEYDNLPHPVQYRQAFIERTRDFDVVIYEYDKGSSSMDNPYCATYIFSIKTDIAVSVINTIKNKEEFFGKKPDKWQLEKNFLSSLRTITNSIHITNYIPNDKEFNIQAAWSRDDMNRNGTNLQFYLAVDDFDYLYLHVISDGNYLIEIVYDDYKKFHSVGKNEFFAYKLGEYKKGNEVNVYYQGTEIFNEFLGKDLNKFREINKLIRKTNPVEAPRTINVNFIDGPFVEILESNEHLYNVKFLRARNEAIEFDINLKSNHWAKSSKKYYIDWIIRITGIDNDFYYEHIFNVTDKKVLISFESKSLGDTLAWFPYVEKFRIDKKCKVVCSTFHNNLFKGQYPNITFVEPGTTVNDIYALYRIGVFFGNGEIDYSKHLTDPKKEPLTKIASDILGLDYIEIKPKLPVLSNKKKKVVSIAVHGTAQCKYWNNPTGWQDVVDFLVEKGYEVKLLSKEEDGYMGNMNPKHVTTVHPGKIENVMKIIQESELFIGISSGLAWVAWGVRTETILISGFTDVFTEPLDGVRRVINKDVCNSCWSDYVFDPGDWNWCPVQKNTDRMFECSKMISSEQVIEQIKLALNL